MRRLSLRVAATVVTAVLVLVLAPIAMGTSEAQAPTVRLIVNFKPGTTNSTQDAVSAEEGDVVQTLASIRARVIEVPAALERLVRKRLIHRSDVKAVETDKILSIATVPNDPVYTSNPGPQQAVNLPSAWDVSTGSTDVTIAIIDTGSSVVGSDLPASKFVQGYNAITHKAVNPSTTMDDHGHGTMTASVAAMIGNNETGAAGACWSCKIMPIKVLSSSGSGTTSAVAEGIDWAVSHGADVISLSLSGGGTTALVTSVSNAIQAGIPVVAAAGNSGTTSTTNASPAAISGVIGVAGTGPSKNYPNNTSYLQRNPDSNYGTWVSIAAPFRDIALGRDGAFYFFDGTSAATPVVAGTIGLALSQRPDLDPAQIRSDLKTTAKKPVSFAIDPASGLLDAGALLGTYPGTTTTVATTVTTTASTVATTATTGVTTTTTSTTTTTTTTLPPTTVTTAASNEITVTGGGFAWNGVVSRKQSVKAGPATFSSCGTCTVEILNSSGTRISPAGKKGSVTMNLGAGSYTFRATGGYWSTVNYTLTYTG